MWHQAHDIAATAANAGNVISRTIYVSGIAYLAGRVSIAKDNAIVTLQFCQRRVVANIVSFGVRDRHAQHGALFQFVGKRRVSVFDSYVDIVSNEMQIAIAN